jgi:hypothetical protein
MKCFLFHEPEKYKTIMRNTQFTVARRCEQRDSWIPEKVEQPDHGGIYVNTIVTTSPSSSGKGIVSEMMDHASTALVG